MADTDTFAPGFARLAAKWLPTGLALSALAGCLYGVLGSHSSLFLIPQGFTPGKLATIANVCAVTGEIAVPSALMAAIFVGIYLREGSLSGDLFITVGVVFFAAILSFANFYPRLSPAHTGNAASDAILDAVNAPSNQEMQQRDRQERPSRRALAAFLILGVALKWIGPVQRYFRKYAGFFLVAAYFPGLVACAWFDNSFVGSPTDPFWVVKPCAQFNSMDWTAAAVGLAIYLVVVLTWTKVVRESLR